ncbi:MAG: hypothetical protein ABIN99_11475, partial [Nitrosospira sp.]
NHFTVPVAIFASYKKTGPETRILFEFQDRKTAVTGTAENLKPNAKSRFTQIRCSSQVVTHLFCRIAIE